jgi:hypothetical protein
MTLYLRYVLLLLLLVGIYRNASPQMQQAKKKDYTLFSRSWYIGLNIGPDFYFGDLNPTKKLFKGNVSLAASLFGEYQATHVVGFRMQLLSGGLNGSTLFDSIGHVYENAFTGILLEGDISAIINFSNFFVPYHAARKIFVYGTLGIGYAGWYSKLLNKVYDISTLETDNPLKNFNAGAVIPVGIGLFYNLKNRYHFGIEWTFRTYFSDKLDNTMGNYKFDVVDYLAFGASLNLGGKSKKPLYVHDYPVAVPMVITKAAETPPRPGPIIEPVDYDYVVQIFAFAKYIHSVEWIRKKYKISHKVIRTKVDGLYRYTIGPYAELEEARVIQKEMIGKGITDAFIIAYLNGVIHHTVTDSILPP